MERVLECSKRVSFRVFRAATVGSGPTLGFSHRLVKELTTPCTLSMPHSSNLLEVLSRFILISLLAGPAFCGEYAVLASGQRMHIDRHEASADTVRLFSSGQSFTEIPLASVVAFELDDYVPPPAPPPPPTPVADAKVPVPVADPKTMVHDAAIRNGLPPKFVESVAKVESAMRTNALSPKGAIGVMQLMPATARALDADPNDPAQNIEAGTRLLRELLIKYNNDAVKALAAYNAGEGAVDRYHGVPPYAETQTYVDKVIRKYQKADPIGTGTP